MNEEYVQDRINLVNKKVNEDVKTVEEVLSDTNIDEIIKENEHLKFFNKFLLIAFFGVSFFSIFGV